MVVASTTRKSGPYNFNGVTTEWPITFEVNGITEAEVLVYTVSGGVSTLVESNYSVDLENLEVVYPSVASGLPPFDSSYGQVLIVRQVSLLQGTDLRNQGPFRAEDIEDIVDRWAMVAQQLQEQLDRAAQSDISGSEADPEIAALLDAVSDARDEATVAASSAEAYADAAEASAISATASYSAVVSYFTSAAASYNSAAAYADAASVSAIASAASAASSAASYASAAALVNNNQITVQVVNTTSTDVATGSTQIPADNTIPQNTEGDEYMTRSITPTSATNKLRIDVVVCVSNDSGTGNIAALFQDSTANALACAAQYETAGHLVTINFTHYMNAGTTSATTFKVRAGNGGTGTTTFNGVSAGRLFGGVCASSITITEIKV